MTECVSIGYTLPAQSQSDGTGGELLVYRRIAADRRLFIERLIAAGDQLAETLARNGRRRVISDAAREQEADARAVWQEVCRDVHEWCARSERVDELQEKRLAARERSATAAAHRERVRVHYRSREKSALS